MPERHLRRRIPANRRARPPHPLPSSRRRIATRRSSNLSRPVRILQRCKSEPTLWIADFFAGDGDSHRNLTPPDFVLLRPETCMSIFSSSPDLFSQSPRKFEGYKKDAKVVVNVTVEGSPGPVRTMVKLGSSVEETIKLVMKNYCKEGRSPRLDEDGDLNLELHHSYFSLQSLNKLDEIGEIGSRSFYLRKSNNGRMEEMASNSISDIVAVRERSPPPPLLFLPSFISQKINKIIRKTRKFWKIMGCMQCSG